VIYLYNITEELPFPFGVSVTPGAGSIVATGFTPTLQADWMATPGLGAVTVTGRAPAVVIGGNASASPGVGTVTVVGFKPALIAVPAAIPPTPAGGDSPGKPLRWQKRDERLQPAFGAVLRRKNFDPSDPPAAATFDPEDSRENTRLEQAAVLAALDALAEELTREKAARGLARVARDAGRKMAAAKVQAATEQARSHAERAMRIAQRLGSGRFIPDEDE
jgi:hypothetical protein